MKILIIADCYLPDTRSAAKLIHDLAEDFVNKSNSVAILVPDNTLNAPYSIDHSKNITVVRARSGKIKGACKTFRAINEIWLSKVIWRSCKDYFRDNPCDFIIFYSPSIFFGKLVLKLKKLWKCKSYLILRDIFPKWAVETGVMKKGPVYCFFKYKEFQQYSAADIIGVESAGNLSYFAGMNTEEKTRIEVLNNWATLNEKEIITNNERQKLGLDEKFVFFYGGNIGIAQEIDNVITLAEMLKDLSEVHFLLIGSGSEVARLNNLVRAKKLANITIHPPVSQQHYLGMLSQFDVGIVSLNGKLKTHNLPAKILSYMYFSKPILASLNKNNDLIDLLDRSQAGLASTAGDHNGFYDNALRLINDKQLAREMGNNARRLLETDFSVAKAAKQIISHADKTCN